MISRIQNKSFCLHNIRGVNFNALTHVINLNILMR